MSDSSAGSPSSRGSTDWLVLGGSGLALLALTFLLVPEYWGARGFPLDDAWIHAVYARAFARGEGLSYNPGVPASGETSPLWAIVLSVAHLGGADAVRAVWLTKLLGFGLHGLTALGLYAALRELSRRWALSAALLVLVSPQLVAASVSGMEVPLSTLAVVAFVLALQRPRPGLYALCGALGPLARPEVGLFLVLLPLAVRARPGWRPVVRHWLEAGVGGLVGGGAWAAWNVYASGLPLPATFYVKVSASKAPVLVAEWVGFTRQLPDVSWPGPVLGLLGALSVGVWVRRQSATPLERLAAGWVLLAGLFCAVSTALLRAPAEDVFYSQRYVLPAVPFLLAALPLLGGGWVESRLARHGPRLPGLIAAALPLLLLPSLGPRLQRLENDAHNIDDLQVQEGLFLARAAPTDTVWVLDAGAPRFFGAAFVVDIIGLNTPQLLEADAQAYLDAHPPRFLEWTEGWARIHPEGEAPFQRVQRFETSTPYTVVPARTMQTRALLECTPGTGGGYQRKNHLWRYQCAGPSRP